MNAAYRQKLLNYFCTVLLIWAGTFIGLLIVWTVGIPEVRSSGFTEVTYPALAMIAEALIVYVLLFPLALFWHLMDFIGKNRPSSPWWNRICDFPAFACALTSVIVFWLLAGTGFFTLNSCDALDGVYYHECFITISLFIMVPLFIAALALLVICAAKFFTTFHSLFLRKK